MKRTRVLAAICVVVFSSAKSSGNSLEDALTVVGAKEVAGGVSLDLQIDTIALIGRLKNDSAPFAPSNFGLADFEYGNFKFTKLRPALTELTLQTSRSNQEVAFVAHVAIWADRARKRWAVAGPWDADGNKNLVDLVVSGRLQIVLHAISGMTIVKIDQVSAQPHVQPLDALQFSVPLGGRIWRQEPFDLPSQLPLTSFQITDVLSDRVLVTAHIALPPEK